MTARLSLIGIVVLALVSAASASPGTAAAEFVRNIPEPSNVAIFGCLAIAVLRGRRRRQI